MAFTADDKAAASYAHVLMTFDRDRIRQAAKNATNDDDRQRILDDGDDLWGRWLRLLAKIDA